MTSRPLVTGGAALLVAVAVLNALLAGPLPRLANMPPVEVERTPDDGAPSPRAQPRSPEPPVAREGEVDPTPDPSPVTLRTVPVVAPVTVLVPAPAPPAAAVRVVRDDDDEDGGDHDDGGDDGDDDGDDD